MWVKENKTEDERHVVWHVRRKTPSPSKFQLEGEKINFILISCDLIKKMWIKRVKRFYGLKKGSKQMEYLIFISRSFVRSNLMHFCALYALHNWKLEMFLTSKKRRRKLLKFHKTLIYFSTSFFDWNFPFHTNG